MFRVQRSGAFQHGLNKIQFVSFQQRVELASQNIPEP